MEARNKGRVGWEQEKQEEKAAAGNSSLFDSNRHQSTIDINRHQMTANDSKRQQQWT